MLLAKALWILSFIVVSFNSGVYCFEWPWNWTKEDVTCYSACLAAVGTGTVVATPFAISSAGFLAAYAAAVEFITVLGASSITVGHVSTMVLASTVSQVCATVCRSSEEGLKCHYERIAGMKGLDANLIKAEKVDNIKQCEGLCIGQTDCRAFRYLTKNNLCFVYNLRKNIEDDIRESQFYVKRCVLCYMNTTHNAKGRDDEIQTVWNVSSFEKCNSKCIKSDDCSAVHFDGKRCFKFNDKVKPSEKTGIDFSRKICVQYTD